MNLRLGILLAGLCTIVVLITTLLYVSYYNSSEQEKYLTGFWTASDDDFCAQCGITSMMLYIGEPVGWYNKERQGYIVISDDICNQGLTLNYSAACFASPVFGGCEYSMTAKFDAEPIWGDDGKVILQFNPHAGTLVVKSNDGNTVYAQLVKSHEVTNICNVE